MSRSHDIDIRHHHCTECGGVMTTAGSIHPRCEQRAQLEVELEAFKARRQKEDEDEEREKEERRARRRFWS